MSRVIVIGGGAAGMMAALAAAGCGHRVTIFEKNEKLGKKLFITGKGRCNVTNASDVEELLAHIPRNKKFLYSAFYALDSFALMDFLEGEGLPLKTERGNRVFPQSDKSSDVIRTLERALKKRGVEVCLNTEVAEIFLEGNPSVRGDIARKGREAFAVGDGLDKKQDMTIGEGLENDSPLLGGVILGKRAGGKKVPADAVIVATGGISYPSTGSTGDGYRFARESGHRLEGRSPSLVPFVAGEDYICQMQGLSLRNVELSLERQGKELYRDFGELLFTHFGLSGPLVLSASSQISGMDLSGLTGKIDLKPALSEKQLDDRVLRDFGGNQNSLFKNSLGKLLPAKMIPVLVSLSGISPEKKVNEVTREERRRLVGLMKAFPFTVEGLRGYNEAIITRGGVSVKDVNPATMESRMVPGLYFAGEVLDVDGMTGGYNLQIAWSTGYLAGISVS